MLLHEEIERLKISTYSRLPYFQLSLVIDHYLHHCRHYHYHRLLLHHLLHFHFYWKCQCHVAIQDEVKIKVFQIKDFATSFGLSRIGLMLNFKNIAASTSRGLRDNRLGAMTSFIPSIPHLDSS
jgi:hypothetical protein